MEAHHTTRGWLVVEWHLRGWWQTVTKTFCTGLLCNAYRSLLGTSLFPAWEHLQVPCLGHLPVPCLGTLASSLHGNAPMSCLGTLCSPCLGRFANSLPGNIRQCPACASLQVPAWDAGQFPALESLCQDAVPNWALFLLLSDKHEKRPTAPLQVWYTTNRHVLLFCFCNERPTKRMKSQGKKNQIETSEGSGWLCENERTRRERGWRECWFAVVDNRGQWAKVKAVDVMHAYLMPTWSKCQRCLCGACVYANV